MKQILGSFVSVLFQLCGQLYTHMSKSDHTQEKISFASVAVSASTYCHINMLPRPSCALQLKSSALSYDRKRK